MAMCQYDGWRCGSCGSCSFRLLMPCSGQTPLQQYRLSLPAHTLLRLLLSPDPSGRLNARALLSHPWLASSPIISSGKISSSYDACAATAFASAASESLLQSMQTRTQSAQDQCVPC